MLSRTRFNSALNSTLACVSRSANAPSFARNVALSSSRLAQRFFSSAEEVRDGNRSQIHFKLTPHRHPLGVQKFWDNPMQHHVWSEEELKNINITHLPTNGFTDKAAFYAIQGIRKAFDKVTGYNPGHMTEEKWVDRIIFLEAIAGCPGMVGGMHRHLRSLRYLRRDYGWIHTLLEEAENERMHLLTFMHMKKPSLFFRTMLVLSQGVFMNAFFVAYLLSPKFCHRLVGYLEEEAVITYTKCLKDIDEGRVWKNAPAPAIAINYWKLKKDATMRDVVEAVRADEANHRDVNHTFAGLRKEGDVNPFIAKGVAQQTP